MFTGEFLRFRRRHGKGISLLVLEQHDDLIIMGTHGRRGISRLVIGSVAKAVLRRAHCPVLTSRAQSSAPAIEGR